MNTTGSILVARLSALGDVVLASTVAVALGETLPGARIEFLAGEPHARILAAVPGLGAVHAWSGHGPAPDPVRARRWDCLIDLSGTGRSRRILAGVRAARRLRMQGLA